MSLSQSYRSAYRAAIRLIGPDVGYVSGSDVRRILLHLHRSNHAISGAAQLVTARPDLEPFVSACLADVVQEIDAIACERMAVDLENPPPPGSRRRHPQNQISYQ